MIIGEAPGKEEDARGKPFTGPAGKLMDKIWESVGMNTNDWYLTNIVKCRPVAPKGSGKQNLTPKVEQKERCKPFLEAEISLLEPKLIVTVGGVATASILGTRSVRIGDYRGKHIHINKTENSGAQRINVFPMLHPAALLHAKKDPVKYKQYREQMWIDIQNLKELVKELEI